MSKVQKVNQNIPAYAVVYRKKTRTHTKLFRVRAEARVHKKWAKTVLKVDAKMFKLAIYKVVR